MPFDRSANVLNVDLRREDLVVAKYCCFYIFVVLFFKYFCVTAIRNAARILLNILWRR